MIDKKDISQKLVGRTARTLIAKESYKKGSNFVIKQVIEGTIDYFYDIHGGGTGFKAHELTIDLLTKEEIQKSISKLKKLIKEEDEKLTIMTVLNLDVYDEDYIRIYRALEVIEGKGSKAEKAKVLTALIKN